MLTLGLQKMERQLEEEDCVYVDKDLLLLNISVGSEHYFFFGGQKCKLLFWGVGNVNYFFVGVRIVR